MRCTQCASPIPDGGSFCSNCGADVASFSSGAGASLDDAGIAKLTRMLRQETAGEYEIEREIGRGGMGVVYLATEIQLRRRVAIKVLPPAFTFGEGAIQRFGREARTAAALDHPNIIPIYRVSSGGELMWYAMKLLEGKSLDTLLQEQERLGFDDIVTMLDQVADALDYAHRRGVIHRDIKPGNIMLDERQRVTVTDFGIAKEIQEGSTATSGALLGTPYYMAPEQYLGGAVSGAADQYSLAVVAYQCLGRHLPFEASSAFEVLSKHVAEAPPPLVDLRPDLPSHAYAAIQQALAKDPRDRFPTVTDFVSALAGRTAAVLPPPRVAPRRTRLIGWGAAGAGVTAVTLYVALVVLQSPSVQGAPPQAPAETDSTSHAASTVTPAASAAVPQPTGTTTVPARDAPSKRVVMAVLVIRVTNGWARIYVDGDLRGERPVHREELPPGTHTLRFERPGFVAVDTTVTLRPGQNVIEVAMQRSGS